MASALEVAGDIASASTALGGLLLVFMGSVANSYESFDASGQRAVLRKYRRRAWLVSIGFFAAMLATVLALGGKWLEVPWMIVLSAISLLASLLVISIAAGLTVQDIS